MCGIVGLFAKTKSFENELGFHFSKMLEEMTDRGPDSAGCAMYHNTLSGGRVKIVALVRELFDISILADKLGSVFSESAVEDLGSRHLLITVSSEVESLSVWLRTEYPELTVLSAGKSIEIYKEKGLPNKVIEEFSIASMSGSHALGHTRMATESAITTAHSHPFSTGDDVCLVHNGSLSNHNRLRTELQKNGIYFSSDNDSEVAAGYLTWRLREGDSIDEALNRALSDLDGFYTFAVGTRDGFAVMRDPIACKPAVISETDDWVAMASEYRAIALLPDANNAPAWEPNPGQVYSWSH
jgi:glutamate synthase domain-containing protein 1